MKSCLRHRVGLCILLSLTLAGIPATPRAALSVRAVIAGSDSAVTVARQALLPKPPVVEALPAYTEVYTPRGAQVCGEISADTVWSAATGVYTVTCDVHVGAGVTLTIEPGVVVQFEHTVDDLVISGALHAIGLEGAPITFQPVQGASPGSWGRVAFLRGSAGVLDYAKLEYGGHEDGQLYLATEQVQALNSVVQYSADTGIVIQMASPEPGETRLGAASVAVSPPSASMEAVLTFLPIVVANGGGVVQPSGPAISNTQVLSNTGFYGGGLYNDSGSPTIQGSTFAGNRVQGHPYEDPARGGGLYNDSGSPIIQNNTFIGNRVEGYGHGGGLYNGSGSPIMADNVFTDNYVSNYGGGLYSESGNPTIQGNRFTSNATGRWGLGGGLYSASGSLTIINNTFDDNFGDAGCGGLRAEDSSVIRDNRFTYNHAGGYSYYASGGGVCAGGNAIIEHNTFIGNGELIAFFASGGGGLSISGDRPTVRNNVFSGNSGFWGAGLYNGSRGATIQGNTFSSNWSWGGYGGGLYNSYNSENAIIEDNLFIGNRAHRGGGLYNVSKNPIIQNNTFVSNTVRLSPRDDEDNIGGGLFTESGNPIIRNNIFAGNEAPSGGGLVSEGGSPVADYNGMWNNTGGDSLGITAGPHDLTVDPLFVNAAAGDFHLMADSPMIDAGDPANYSETDFEGDPRPQGSGPDIGADEYRPK